MVVALAVVACVSVVGSVAGVSWVSVYFVRRLERTWTMLVDEQAEALERERQKREWHEEQLEYYMQRYMEASGLDLRSDAIRSKASVGMGRVEEIPSGGLAPLGEELMKMRERDMDGMGMATRFAGMDDDQVERVLASVARAEEGDAALTAE